MGGELPQTTGREVAGVVNEVGEGVTDVTVGDRVFGFSDDGAGAAELALLSHYAPIPPSLGFAAEIGELIESGRFSLPVAQTFPLAEIAAAHRVSEDGHVRGKLVLLVG